MPHLGVALDAAMSLARSYHPDDWRIFHFQENYRSAPAAGTPSRRLKARGSRLVENRFTGAAFHVMKNA